MKSIGFIPESTNWGTIVSGFYPNIVNEVIKSPKQYALKSFKEKQIINSGG